MKKYIKGTKSNNNITTKQVYDYYENYGKIEKEKKDSRSKMIQEQLNKVLHGKNVIISNKS